MSEHSDSTHGPGEDVIDPAGPFLGWVAIGLLVLMAAFVAVLAIAGMR